MDNFDVNQMLQTFHHFSGNVFEQVSWNSICSMLGQELVKIDVKNLGHDEKVPSKEEAVFDLDK